MLSMRWNRFPVCSACDEISSPYAQCAIKFVPRMLSMDCTCKNVHILPLAVHVRKFVPSMLSMRWNRFRVCSACDEISSPYAQCAIKFVPRMLSKDCTCNNVHILPLAEHARKFVPRMLSMRWNRFRVCSACDKIVSAYAQHTHAIIFENDSKIPN